ncbi:hypothetical protein [Thalassoroseus pseudoceratinae]|uniref:hypothetical protein n=1 Tax=Thalassoroseus pseudoceratinae TaxID=2713176 RepID=UPI001421926C|nr:hypothetical protein [Thalassoroseus pseudoceratinae]
MSELLIPCPKCSSALKLPNRSLLGKLGKCPQCQHKFVLKEPEEVELQLAEDEPAIGTAPQWVPDEPAVNSPAGNTFDFPGVSDEPAFPVVGEQAPETSVAVETQPEPAVNETPSAPLIERGQSKDDVVKLLGKPAKKKIVAAKVKNPKTGEVATRKREYLLFQHAAGPYKILFDRNQVVEIHSQPESATKATAVAEETAATASVSTSSYRPGQRKKKQRLMGILTGAGIAAVIVGGVVWVNNQPAPVADTGPKKEPPKVDKRFVQEKSTSESAFTASNEFLEKTMPPKGQPIPLEMAPLGTSAVINLHPADLWGTNPQFQEFRAALGPLGTWLEGQIETLSGFQPTEIAELQFYLAQPGQNLDPILATNVRLVEPRKRSAFLVEYGFKRLEGTDSSDYYTKDGRAYLLRPDPASGDVPSFSVWNMRDIEEMKMTESGGGSARPGLDELLPMTDRNRPVSVVFSRNDLLTFREEILPENIQPAAEVVLEWLDAGVEIDAVAWSMQLTDRQFVSQLQVRSGNSGSSLQTVTRTMEKHLRQLPEELLGMVRKMSPAQRGYRQLIGRFPAMMQMYSLKTLTGKGDRFVQLTTVLDERAAPNLALAALLTWDESTRTDFSKSVGPAPTSKEPQLPTTIAGRLKLPIEAEFTRRPLQEAITDIAEATKLTIVIDGDALKFAGYTKNMPQSFNLGIIPSEQALAKIFSQYDKMCICIKDEQKMTLEVTTFQFAEKNKLKPLELEMPKE